MPGTDVVDCDLAAHPLQRGDGAAHFGEVRDLVPLGQFQHELRQLDR